MRNNAKIIAAYLLLLLLCATLARAAGPVVNVNDATPEELAYLPGIGPAKAADIVASRPYVSVEDLDRARGIGPATVEKLRPHVVLEGETTATEPIRTERAPVRIYLAPGISADVVGCSAGRCVLHVTAADGRITEDSFSIKGGAR